MKKYLILLLLAAVCGPLSAQTQHEVHDFYSLMTAVPVDEDSSVISLKKRDSMVVVKRYPLGNISEFTLKSLEKIGPDIDNLGIIDYKSDTVFISDFIDFYSGYFLVATKSDRVAFNMLKNPVEYSKIELPEYVDFNRFFIENYAIKKSLFEIFSDWSEDKFIELIDIHTHGYIVMGNSNILIRLVVKDNFLVKKDIYYYEELMFLNRKDDAFKYWQTHILPNKEQ